VTHYKITLPKYCPGHCPTLRNAEIERTRRKAPRSLNAYDYFSRALPHYDAMTRDGNDTGLRMLDHALALEPRFGLAAALKTQMLGWRDVPGWTQPASARHPELLHPARDSVQFDPHDPEILAGAAHLIAWAGGDYDEAMQLAERALAISGNSAFV
jgi:adenylate cyclase